MYTRIYIHTQHIYIGYENLSEEELGRRIPPEIAMYEDLFHKILRSAEILVQVRKQSYYCVCGCMFVCVCL